MKKILLTLTILISLLTASLWLLSYRRLCAYTHIASQNTYTLSAQDGTLFYTVFSNTPEDEGYMQRSIPLWLLESLLLTSSALLLWRLLKNRRRPAPAFPL